MKKTREYLLLIFFPVFYILIDAGFRSKYLVNYSGKQMLFYAVSILFSLSIFAFTIVLMTKNGNRKKIKYPAGLTAAFYYSSTILSSYIFLLFTGIFPNYYTFTYLKNEPANAVSLIKDSVHLWQILFFTIFLFSFFYYFLHVSKTEIAKKISLKTKPLILVLVILFLLIIQVKNIHSSDQCMIVDANFTVDISTHLSDWNSTKTFAGDGLPLRDPVKLKRTNRKPEFNILIIIFESLRTQNMNVYGYGRDTTPFLSSLKNENPENFYIFRNNYTVSTTTMFAIPAILSGITPDQPVRFYETYPLVWEYAAMLNYHTFFISSHGMQWYRFDKYYSNSIPDFYWNKDTSSLPPYNDFGIDDRITAEKLNEHISSLKNKPFFGVMQFNATHFPYKVPVEYKMWDEKYIDKYDNSVLYQDNLLEKIFSGLSKQGVLKNTVVIMVGDHGEAFKEHNSIGHIDTYNSETVSIPLMVYIPAAINSRINSTQVKINTELNTTNSDIVPTVINLLGLRNDKQISLLYGNFNGVNLFEPFNKNRNIITLNGNEIINFNSGVSLIKGDHHYILRTNIVPYSREFYDIKSDPTEKTNTINSAEVALLEKFNIILSENINCRKIINLYPREK